MKEEWKQVAEGVEVSSLGRVRRTTTPSTKGIYPVVTINKKTWYVHTLVWEAWNGKKKKGYVIDHIDMDKTNNKLSNLEMVTASENVSRWTKTGLKKRAQLGGKCRKGHDKQGKRWCPTCRAQRAKERNLNPPDLDWKRINERYMVSRCGQVWGDYFSRLLKQHLSPNGYFQVQFSDNHKLDGKSMWSVHRLVHRVFIGPVPSWGDKEVVDHIDGNKLNNHASNLQRISCSENIKRSWIQRKKKEEKDERRATSLV